MAKSALGKKNFYTIYTAYTAFSVSATFTAYTVKRLWSKKAVGQKG